MCVALVSLLSIIVYCFRGMTFVWVVCFFYCIIVLYYYITVLHYVRGFERIWNCAIQIFWLIDWFQDHSSFFFFFFKVVFCLQTVSTIKTREWYIFNPTPCTSEKNQHFYCFSNNLFIVQPKIKGIKEPQRTCYTIGMTSFLFNENIILDRHSHSSKTF